MEIDMKRHSSGGMVSVAEMIDRRDVWRVRTDFKADYDEETQEERGVTFIEHEFLHKPSIAEAKEFCLGVINKQTDEKILSKFVWNDIHVWLSDENQRNFSEAQRIASVMPQAILPVTFKLGEDANDDPVYYEFTTAEELTQFYLSAVAYINQCLAEGWQRKDSFDWSDYEAILGG